MPDAPGHGPKNVSSRRVDSSILQSLDDHRQQTKRGRPSSRERSLDGFGEGNRSGRGNTASIRGGVGNSKGLSPQVLMGIIAGVVIIIGLALFASSKSGSGPGPNKAPAVNVDNLSIRELEARGLELEKAHKPLEAADMYNKAADAASRAGDEASGQRLNMKAYSLRKHTPIDIRR
jgi:hypothetical protein